MHALVSRNDPQESVWKSVLKFARSYSAPLVLLVATAGVAQGQATPNTKPADSNRDTMRRDEPMYRNGRDNRDNGEYPASDIHSAVEANARTAYARANYHRLQDSLNVAIHQMQSSFDQSPELTDARKAEQAAWEDYAATRNAALKSVVSDPKYQANIALKNDTGEQIADVRSAYGTQSALHGRAGEIVDKSKMGKLVLLATVKLDYAQVATDMEVAALKGDSKVADTRSKLMTAGARVQALREGFDRTLRGSPELASIRSRIEDARVAFITAEAFRDGAVEAANEALDYAYYKNRHASYAGYEYGYSTGYGTGR